MASDRDTLAAYLDAFGEQRAWADTGAEAAEHIVSVLGWRPPARVIETDEECDALPVGTIVLDNFSAGCTRVHRDPYIGWVRATSALRSRMGHQQHRPWLPATVLYTPENGDTGE